MATVGVVGLGMGDAGASAVGLDRCLGAAPGALSPLTLVGLSQEAGRGWVITGDSVRVGGS